MSEELKPCPFCGGEANLHKSDEFWYVACNECVNQTTHFYNGKDIVIQRWNTRNDRAVIDGFLARVRDELKKGYFTREQIVSLDLIFNIVAAEMFGKEGE